MHRRSSSMTSDLEMPPFKLTANALPSDDAVGTGSLAQATLNSFDENRDTLRDLPSTYPWLVLQQVPTQRLGDVLQHSGAIGFRCLEQLWVGVVDVLGDLVGRFKQPQRNSRNIWHDPEQWLSVFRGPFHRLCTYR